MKKYYSMEKANNAATINIYGDITSWPWLESDVSATNLSQELDALGDVSQIDVYINSYGGEVAEGLAIYNALKRHKAKVRTICDGFACSIASVIFMAGDERVMNEASLLMIHNAWTWASGNAEQLRKQADDLEKITQASVNAYKAHCNLAEEEIKALMDAETWMLPDEALEYGFATAVETTETTNASQSARKQLVDIIRAYQKAEQAEEEPEGENEDDAEDGENPETEDEPTNDDPEEPENNPDDEGEEEQENNEGEAVQMWSGFFNALTKM